MYGVLKKKIMSYLNKYKTVLNVLKKKFLSFLYIRKFSSSPVCWVSCELVNLKNYSQNKNKNKIDETVKLLLNSTSFWIYCYENMDFKSDLIKNDFFFNLVNSVRNGSFFFNNVNNVQVSINSIRNKLVLKGIAVILQTLSEYRFYEGSFAFKSDKNCHDVIKFIKKKVPFGVWALEGDISNCFDSFDHSRVVSLISNKYVGLQIFKDLLYKALKTKNFSLHSSFIKKINTAQGSILSPILCNIFLNELDAFLLNSSEIAAFKLNKQPEQNHKFVKYIRPTEAELQNAALIKKSKGKKKYWKFLHVLRVKKIKKASLLGFSRSNYKNKNRQFLYVRYAHSFILFIWARKKDCDLLKKKIKTFISGELNLNLSTAKMKIVYLKKEKANFLGFQFFQTKGMGISKKKDINPFGKIDRNNINSKYRGAVRCVPKIRITFSQTKVLSEFVDKGFARFKDGKFFPTSYKPVLSYESSNIVNYLRSIFLSIACYYSFCDNWYDAKNLYNYFGKFCVAMTLAHKHKTKISKIFQKYGNELIFTKNNGAVYAQYGVFDPLSFKERMHLTSNVLPENDFEHLLKKNLKLAKKSLLKLSCIICGSSPAELYHIEQVKNVLENKKFYNVYVEACSIIKRKTLPLCKKHQLEMHNNIYDEISLKNMFQNADIEGYNFNFNKYITFIKKIEENVPEIGQ